MWLFQASLSLLLLIFNAWEIALVQLGSPNQWMFHYLSQGRGLVIILSIGLSIWTHKWQNNRNTRRWNKVALTPRGSEISCSWLDACLCCEMEFNWIFLEFIWYFESLWERLIAWHLCLKLQYKLYNTETDLSAQHVYAAFLYQSHLPVHRLHSLGNLNAHWVTLTSTKARVPASIIFSELQI